MSVRLPSCAAATANMLSAGVQFCAMMQAETEQTRIPQGEAAFTLTLIRSTTTGNVYGQQPAVFGSCARSDLRGRSSLPLPLKRERPVTEDWQRRR